MDIGQADRLTALGIRFHVRFDGYVEQSGDLMHRQSGDYWGRFRGIIFNKKMDQGSGLQYYQEISFPVPRDPLQ